MAESIHSVLGSGSVGGVVDVDEREAPLAAAELDPRANARAVGARHGARVRAFPIEGVAAVGRPEAREDAAFDFPAGVGGPNQLGGEASVKGEYEGKEDEPEGRAAEREEGHF